MAGLLQYYFFPTDFYYPRPQQVKTTSQKQQQNQEVAAVPAALQPQKKQDWADDQGGHHQILENNENPFNNLAISCSVNMRDNSGMPALKSSGGAATSNFSTIYKLRKLDKDLIRAVMFEDYGF